MAAGCLAEISLGPCVNYWMALPPLVLLFIWARLLTWIDKDVANAVRLSRVFINLGLFAGLVLGYILFFMIGGGFWPAFGALLGLFLVDVGAYLGLRANAIGLTDLKETLLEEFSSLTPKKKVKVINEAGIGRVMLMDRKGSPAPVPSSAEDPTLPQYEAAQALLYTPLSLGAQRIDASPVENTPVAYQVDGVRYQGDAMDRDAIAAAIHYLKPLAELDIGERRKPQTGTFKVLVGHTKLEVQITTSGSTAGESATLLVEPKKRFDFNLETLGLTAEQIPKLQSLITEDRGGLVLLSAPKGQGLTALQYTVIRAHDAFMYHIHTIERGPEMDLEGITQNALPLGVSPAEELKQVEWVLSQQPDVAMLTSIHEPRSALAVAQFADDSHRAYVGLNAGSTLDALRQWRKMVGDENLATKPLKLIVTGTLVRRLCTACKVGYTPDPATLKKMNMNPELVGTLYQARKEPIRDAKGHVIPCQFCNDLAFKGRIGVFEVFVIDDEIRGAVRAGASENQLRQLFRKQRGKLLQEQALALVEKGETSVEEVLRVLKATQPPPAGATTATKPKAPAAKPGGAAGPVKNPPPR